MNRFILALTLLFAIGCKNTQDENKPKITGLWVVEEVKVGKEVMTPNARWMRFNEDSTQQSGNGWQQHSIGTYYYSITDSTLTITNTNGYEDIYAPFKVSFKDKNMLWKRVEDGAAVTVILKKTDRLPAAYGDKLLGVWDLEKITENGKDVTSLYDEEQKNYLYIRWDGKFIVNNSTAGRTRGIYNVNAHRPEVELIVSINDTLQKERWQFEANDSTLVFENAKTNTKKFYKRIFQMPN